MLNQSGATALTFLLLDPFEACCDRHVPAGRRRRLPVVRRRRDVALLPGVRLVRRLVDQANPSTVRPPGKVRLGTAGAGKLCRGATHGRGNDLRAARGQDRAGCAGTTCSAWKCSPPTTARSRPTCSGCSSARRAAARCRRERRATGNCWRGCRRCLALTTKASSGRWAARRTGVSRVGGGQADPRWIGPGPPVYRGGINFPTKGLDKWENTPDNPPFSFSACLQNFLM